jgi:chromatin remodeling complex protein RSC6
MAKKKPAKKKAAKKKVKKAVKKTVKKVAKKPAKKKSARKPNAAFMAKLTPSATLAAVIGDQARPRTDMIKKIWDYIKKNGLQDKVNRRMINADDKLRALFSGKGQVSMFDLAKIVSANVS